MRRMSYPLSQNSASLNAFEQANDRNRNISTDLKANRLRAFRIQRKNSLFTDQTVANIRFILSNNFNELDKGIHSQHHNKIQFFLKKRFLWFISVLIMLVTHLIFVLKYLFSVFC